MSGRRRSLASNESFFEGDLADKDAMHAALEGMDGVIHLGGLPREADIEDMLQTNILGTYNLYDAARATGVNRVVFASSNHATGFYPRSATITPSDIPRPDTRYGLSKCWGEMVAGFYYDKAGISTLSIRIGNAGAYPNSERSAAIWISPATFSSSSGSASPTRKSLPPSCMALLATIQAGGGTRLPSASVIARRTIAAITCFSKRQAKARSPPSSRVGASARQSTMGRSGCATRMALSFP